MLHPGPKLLLITLRAMGDTLLATPLIRDLARKYPDAIIDLLAEHIPGQAVVNNPHLSRVWMAPPRRSSWKEYLPLIKVIRRQKYSTVIDLLSTPGSALLTRLTGAPLRLGYRLRGRTWAYTRPVVRDPTPRYNPLVKYDLALPLGVSCSNPYPEIYPRPEDNTWADNFISKNISPHIEQLGLADLLDYTPMGVAPWSVRSWRSWEDEAWLDTMRRISRRRQVVWILFAAPNERSELVNIEQANSLAVAWAGATHVLSAAALMRRCRLLLCAENGLKHVAVAAGTPTLTIYRDYRGVQPDSWNPPGDSSHKHLVTASGLSVADLSARAAVLAEELLNATAG
ncbi:MAG: glycosyltransferase family 9 protein [Calditrichota bacterium]